MPTVVIASVAVSILRQIFRSTVTFQGIPPDSRGPKISSVGPEFIKICSHNFVELMILYAWRVLFSGVMVLLELLGMNGDKQKFVEGGEAKPKIVQQCLSLLHHMSSF
ncbi:hypothetical protein AAHA92_06295 [Salvia divinorum]|uniref:Uncharacterized protein n=1 Tax=Salvia divinorum TaxID=28513 RepID=A0ABD1I971_SALDI